MKEETFYLVREDVLPEAMRKTLEVKKLIERKKAESVAEAVQKVDLSRSAFYKYRDAVFPFYTMVKEQIITLFFIWRTARERCPICSKWWLNRAATCCRFTRPSLFKEERMSRCPSVREEWMEISIC